MLDEVENAMEVEGWMPATPVWHAPFLAILIIALGIFYNGPAEWQVPAALVGFVVVVGGLADQLRRQRAKPRRLRRPWRLLTWYGVIGTVSIALFMAWDAVSWPAERVSRIAILVGGWLLTTGALGIGITVTNRMGDYWAAPGR